MKINWLQEHYSYRQLIDSQVYRNKLEKSLSAILKIETQIRSQIKRQEVCKEAGGGSREWVGYLVFAERAGGQPRHMATGNRLPDSQAAMQHVQDGRHDSLHFQLFQLRDRSRNYWMATCLCLSRHRCVCVCLSHIATLCHGL